MYGAVAFQYFTTWSIVREDEVSDIYPYIKQVNEELKMMEDIPEPIFQEEPEDWNLSLQASQELRQETRET